MHPYFKFSNKLLIASQKAEQKAAAAFEKIDAVTQYNQQKVLAAFIKNKVSESHFAATTGYGYGDRGRDVLDKVFADSLGTEDALVRHSFLSGTHTLSVALYGILRPGDILLSVTGSPYDTLEEIIGIRGKAGDGSLKDFGVEYMQVDLKDGCPDHDKIAQYAANDKVKMAYIQRSRGYSLRNSLSVDDIGEIVKTVRAVNKNCVIMVDNCYGEFVEYREPTAVGADLIAGSLIKNPGGGIASTGGYIAGRSDLIELCSYRLSTVGTGREVGCSLGHNRELFMGLFNAPHVTGEALKTAVFCAALMQELGYDVTPSADTSEHRADIIQVVKLGNRERLIAFCQGMQSGAPVDAFVTPEPWDMPGYDSQVIMAAGAFTMGASIELSADAPLREPYAVYMQGGLNYHSGKTGVMLAAQRLLDYEDSVR